MPTNNNIPIPIGINQISLMKKLMILALVAMFATFSVAAAGPGPKAKQQHAKQCKKGKKGKCHKGGAHKRMNKPNVPVTPNK